MTEKEWAAIAPLLPPARRGGRKRTVNIRAVFDGLRYVLSTGGQGRALPKDVPPRSTVFDYFGLWQADGTSRRSHAALYVKCRGRRERTASPTACLIDSQRVQSAEKGGGGLSHRGSTRANESKARSATC